MNTKKDTDEDNLYHTSDLNVSAYLECAGVELVRVQRSTDAEGHPSKRVLLYFRRGPGHEKLIAEYFSGKGKVSAKQFANNLKDLKSRIYSV